MAYAAFLEAADCSMTPMMSDSFMMRRSWPSMRTSVPDHLPNSTRSPALTSRGWIFPLSSRAPGPTAMISPSWGFLYVFGLRGWAEGSGVLVFPGAAGPRKLHEALKKFRKLTPDLLVDERAVLIEHALGARDEQPTPDQSSA